MDWITTDPRESAIFVRIGSVSNVCFLLNYNCPVASVSNACLAAKFALETSGLFHDTDKAVAVICCAPDTEKKNCFFMQRSRDCIVAATKADIEVAVARLLRHERPRGEPCAAVIVDIRTSTSALPFALTEVQLDKWKGDSGHYRLVDDAGDTTVVHIDELYLIAH